MKIHLVLMYGLITLLLTGCMGSDDKSSTQVAVKVNGEEVTFTEYNEYLKRIPVQTSDEKQVEEIKKKVLEGLVEQKLLLQAAKEAGVDRSADVMASIDMAKNKLIVDAYIEKALATSFYPNEKEVEDFYEKNNALLSNRKSFFYDQYVIAADKEKVEQLSESVQTLDKASQLEDFFENNRTQYSKSTIMKTSEQLPKQLLQAFGVLKQDDIGYFKVADGIVVIGMKKIQDQPLSMDQAKKFIVPQIEKQNREEAIAKLVASLKKNAVIELNPLLEKSDESKK